MSVRSQRPEVRGRIYQDLNIFSKAVEILDSIRWVCEDQPELKDMMGELLHSYNKTSWESMNKYCSLKDKKCYQFYMVAGL